MYGYGPTATFSFSVKAKTALMEMVARTGLRDEYALADAAVEVCSEIVEASDQGIHTGIRCTRTQSITPYPLSCPFEPGIAVSAPSPTVRHTTKAQIFPEFSARPSGARHKLVGEALACTLSSPTNARLQSIALARTLETSAHSLQYALACFGELHTQIHKGNYVVMYCGTASAPTRVLPYSPYCLIRGGLGL